MNTNSSTSSSFSMSDIHQPVLKVIGMGGGGCNAVSRMMELGMQGVEFIAANTDHQALENNPAPVKIQLGPRVTRGLGAGGDPKVGQAAAEESKREIAAALAGADMVFLTAGMGGGTGTGSIPVAAEIARDLGAVTIGIVSTPFSFEMGRRQRNATEGVARLREKTNTLIAIPNDRLLYVAPRNLPMEHAFHLADDVLRQAVQGITELITVPGVINVDFAHIRRLIRLGGGAIMAIGQDKGENKALKAMEQALHHPLLDAISLENAAGVIVNFTGGDDLTLGEVTESLAYLQSQTGPQTEVVMGMINDSEWSNRVQVILVITGLGAPTLEEALSGVSKPLPIQQTVQQPSIEVPAVSTRFPAQANIPSPAQVPVRRPISSFPSAAMQEVVSEAQSTLRSQPIQPDALAASQNLDLPAFLRRRTRFATGTANG